MVAPLLAQRGISGFAKYRRLIMYNLVPAFGALFLITYIPVMAVSIIRADDKKCTNAYGANWDNQSRPDGHNGTHNLCVNIKTYEERKTP